MFNNNILIFYKCGKAFKTDSARNRNLTKI